MNRETGIREAVVKALAALDKAEKQFAFYAEHHRAKGAGDKAATNAGYSIMCGDALEGLRLYFRPSNAP
jgi:hypothetical protein